MPKERVMVFIDGSNLYHNLKLNNCGTRVDIGKLAQFLCGPRRLMRTYYFNAIVNQRDDPEKYREQEKFFDALRRIPYFEVKLGRLERQAEECPTCKNKIHHLEEKGVDVALSTDMLSKAYSGQYDVAILVSTDGDFAPLCQEVKNLAKHVEVVRFEKTSSKHLLDVCDKVILLEKKNIEKFYL